MKGTAEHKHASDSAMIQEGSYCKLLGIHLPLVPSRLTN